VSEKKVADLCVDRQNRAPGDTIMIDVLWPQIWTVFLTVCKLSG